MKRHAPLTVPAFGALDLCAPFDPGWKQAQNLIKRIAGTDTLRI